MNPSCHPIPFWLGLTSIHWREAWKYGERAYRYCQHDAGHAIATVRYAAAALGWQARLLTSWSDADIGTILGLDRDNDFGTAEREHPDAMLLVTARQTGFADDEFAAGTCIGAVKSGQWQGRANVLSSQHGHDWPVIDEVALACKKPSTTETLWHADVLPEPLTNDSQLSAVTIIKQRRSAQAFDGISTIAANTFYRMLDMTLPRPATAPWDAINWEPRVHLALFVHRVEGLTPGLYLFLRNDRIETTLRTAVSSELEWTRVEGCPAHLRLFHLATGDARAAARTLSCHQDIAADGAFSLGMLAEYETSLTPAPWAYRQLFWETGILGQVLYLEAEAANAPRLMSGRASAAASLRRAAPSLMCRMHECREGRGWPRAASIQSAKPPKYAAPASVATLTMPCTNCWDSKTRHSRACTTSRSVARSPTPVYRRSRPMRISNGPDPLRRSWP